jgi:hypothetical protein
MKLLRKRCIRGKSCGATCIDPNERCLLELPGGASGEVSKVKKQIKSAAPSKEPVKGGELYTQGKDVDLEELDRRTEA